MTPALLRYVCKTVLYGSRFIVICPAMPSVGGLERRALEVADNQSSVLSVTALAACLPPGHLGYFDAEAMVNTKCMRGL